MARVTKPGKRLAQRLAPSIGIPSEVFETCSLIHRHAVTYKWLCERECDGPPNNRELGRLPIKQANMIRERFETWRAHREELIEKRIAKLAARLPGVGVVFTAFYVILTMPDGRYDSFNREGICVLD